MATPSHVNPKTFKKMLVRSVILPLALMGALAAILLLQIRFLIFEAGRAERSEEVIASTYEAEKLFINMETGLRGYLVTGNPAFLEPYTSADVAVGPSLRSLENLVADYPAHLGYLDRIREYQSQWKDYSHTVRQIRETGGDYVAYSNRGIGKKLMDRIRGEFASLVQAEVQERDARRRSVKTVTWVVSATAVFIALALGGALALFARRQLLSLSRSYSLVIEMEREGQARTSSIVESAMDAIITIDSDQRVLFFNRAAGQMFRCPPGEAVGQPLDRFLPERFRSSHAQHIRDFGQSSVTSRKMGHLGIIYGLRADGEEFPIEASISQVEVGGRKSFTVILRDITERLRSEQALRESEERLQTVVENLTEGLVISDMEGHLLHWNRAGLRMHGMNSLDEGLGLLPRFGEIFELSTLDGSVLPYDRWPLPRIIRGERLQNFEARIRRVGTPWERIFSYGGAIVHEPGGKPLAFVTITDITEHVKLEEQLRQSQKMEAVGQLAGGVAHDFNNLLTAIIGYSDLSLVCLAEQDRLYPYIDEVRKAAQRAAALTRQLLAFSRKQVLQPKVLDLDTVVGEMEKMLQRLLPESIELNTSLRLRGQFVSADPGQLEQVLMNLVVNARDAMPRGGKLAIETSVVELDEAYAATHAEVQAGRYVMLAVSDTGTGMDEATQQRIFEPFFTTKGVGKGTGLGLSTVYGIVKQSGGHIWVYSEPGLGTTFKVYLPQVEAGAGTQEGRDRLKPSSGAGTILLVEDEEVVRNLTRKLLEQGGYQVLEASNGEEALRICEEFNGPISLLLTDVVMPGMSGRALAEQLKGIRPSLPVLYMSGYTDEAILHHGMLESGLALLEKPFTQEELHRKVHEAIQV